MTKEKKLEIMFSIVGIKKEDLYNALRKMGRKYLKVDKDKWTPERPTVGYCYVVSEYVYHYLAPEGTEPYRLKTNDSSHWFLKYPDGQIIDLTFDQYDDELNYNIAQKRNFITKKPSKTAQLLNIILNTTGEKK